MNRVLERGSLVFWGFREEHACLVASVTSDSLWPHGPQPTRLLCPWDSPSKNTGVGYHVLLQGIFQTQASNLRLLHCRWISSPLSHQGNPWRKSMWSKQPPEPAYPSAAARPPAESQQGSGFHLRWTHDIGWFMKPPFYRRHSSGSVRTQHDALAYCEIKPRKGLDGT